MTQHEEQIIAEYNLGITELETLKENLDLIAPEALPHLDLAIEVIRDEIAQFKAEIATTEDESLMAERRAGAKASRAHFLGHGNNDSV